MADRVFVDTNVLVYADDPNGGAKRTRAIEVLTSLIAEERAVISTQVLQEYYVVVTRKLGLPPEDARLRVEALSRLDLIVVRPELILDAIDLQRLHTLAFWDALIVRCASSSGCRSILSEDLNNGQTIDGVAIVNPFAPPTRAAEPRARYIKGRGARGRRSAVGW